MIEPNCRKIIRFEKRDYFLFGLDQIVRKFKFVYVDSYNLNNLDLNKL